MDRRPTRYLELLKVLARHDVEFIVVGGVAAVVEGAPIATLDLDVVFDQSPDNLERLELALGSVNARYRDPAGRQLVPSRSRLEEARTNLLLTDLSGLGNLGQQDRSLSAAAVFVPEPELEIVKTVLFGDNPAGCPGDPILNDELLGLQSGDTVTYCYVVTNPGTAPLIDVVLEDGLSPFIRDRVLREALAL